MSSVVLASTTASLVQLLAALSVTQEITSSTAAASPPVLLSTTYRISSALCAQLPVWLALTPPPVSLACPPMPFLGQIVSWNVLPDSSFKQYRTYLSASPVLLLVWPVSIPHPPVRTVSSASIFITASVCPTVPP